MEHRHYGNNTQYKPTGDFLMSFGFGFGFPRVARVSGAWTPASLPSLALWLDADDAGTITLNGTDVSQ